MMKIRSRWSPIATLVLLLSAGEVAAGEEDPPEPQSFGFATLDHHGDYSGVALHIGITSLPSGIYDYVDEYGTEYSVEATGYRGDLYVQHVRLDGWGLYLNAPTTKMSVYENGENRSPRQTSGNIDVGALHALRWDRMRLLLRLGATLPNANRRTFVLDTGHGRLTDLMTQVPRTGWARLSGSPMIRHGAYFARADLGLDVRAWLGDDWDDAILPHAVGRLGLGAGRSIGPFTAALELASVAVRYDQGSYETDHTLAATVQLEDFFPRFYLGFVTPLDDSRGELYVVTFGLQMIAPRPKPYLPLRPTPVSQ